MSSLAPLSTFGIGSVPFIPAENSCEVQFRRWDIPSWPQYPARSLRENFLFQFLSSFPGLEISGRDASFNEARYLQEEKRSLEKLEETFTKKDFLSFEPTSEWALGYSQMKDLLERNTFPEKQIVKLQVTGPGTVWKSFFLKRIKRDRTQRIQKNLCRTLIAVGLAQIQRVQSHKRIPLIFIDEPIRFSKVAELTEMVNAFKKFGALVGLHVCSSLDWKGFEKLKIDIFHFDLTAHPKLDARQRAFLQIFFKQKRWIAWGVVPTQSGVDFKAQDFSELFIDCVKELSDKVWPFKEILRRSLIAPACGTGTLTPAQDKAVSGNVKEVKKTLDTIN